MSGARILARFAAPRLTVRSKRRIAAQRDLWRSLTRRAAVDMMARTPSLLANEERP